MKIERKKLILAAKFAVVLSVPVVLWAYKLGPDAHHTAVPGTGEASCNDIGCHVGTALNGGGGSVTLTASGGKTYTPGQQQTITIKSTDAKAKSYGFAGSETPCFVGRAVAALAADPHLIRKSGGLFSSWGLSEEYGFTDVDGARPHWGRYGAEHFPHLGKRTPRSGVEWTLSRPAVAESGRRRRGGKRAATAR